MPLGGLLTAGIVVGAGSLAYGAGSSISKNKKAKEREEAAGAKPVYNIQEPTLKNQGIAENLAQQGLSDESRMMYEQQANRGLSESIDALLKVGGGVNSVSDLYSTYQDKSADLANLNDQIKFRNQQMLMAQNEKMANELDKQYQLNVLDPWKDEKQAIAELRTIARNDLNVGIAGASNAVMGIAGAMSGLQKTTNTPTTDMTTTAPKSTQTASSQVFPAIYPERGYYDPNNPNNELQNRGQNTYLNNNYYLQSLFGR